MPKLLKKSQLWYFDFILGVTLFSMILVISMLYLKDSRILQGDEKSDILAEIDRFSESLMSEGVPVNWSNEDVIVPGILSESALDTDKAMKLSNMTTEDYLQVKLIYGVNYDFLVYFTSPNESIINISVIGKPGYNLTLIQSEDPDELVQINRYATYRHDGVAGIALVKVVMWN
ncbi:MAG: hypothetical protein ABIJ34_02975 [archaeon]